MKKKSKSSVYTGVRIPAVMRELAERKAESDGRTLSGYIKRLIQQDIASNGCDAKKNPTAEGKPVSLSPLPRKRSSG